jgi:hypothetical protein
MPLALLGVLALSGWAAWTALAASAPPTPTITSSPINPTNAQSATFTYASSGATGFLCKLDAAASFTTCPTPGITYSALASGSHTFQVRAVDKNGHTSSAASHSWVIDRTAPTVASILRADANPTKSGPLRWTVTFSEPVKNVATSNFTLVTSNVGATAPTVTAAAPSGSAPSSTWAVTASTSGATGSDGASIGLNLTAKATIQDAAGNALASVPVIGQQYTFDTTPPTTSAVSIARNGNPLTNAASVSWTVTFGEAVTGVVAANFSLASSGLSGTPTITAVTGSATTRTITATTGTATPSGSGTLQLKLVRTTPISDLAGNALVGVPPVNGQTYTIDRLAPPVAFTTKPADPSSVSTSQFSWTSQPASDVDHFDCATENGAFSTQVPSQGGPAKPCATPLTYAVATTSNARHQFGLRAYDDAGNFTEITYSWKVAAGSIQNFEISGNAVDLLYPGGPAQAIALKLTNPNFVAIYVTAAQVTVASSSSAGCSPATNVTVTQSDVSATKPVRIPARAWVTLPTQGVAAPKIRMLNLSTNQDACKNATFSLSYTGSAHA